MSTGDSTPYETWTTDALEKALRAGQLEPNRVAQVTAELARRYRVEFAGEPAPHAGHTDVGGHRSRQSGTRGRIEKAETPNVGAPDGRKVNDPAQQLRPSSGRSPRTTERPPTSSPLDDDAERSGLRLPVDPKPDLSPVPPGRGRGRVGLAILTLFVGLFVIIGVAIAGGQRSGGYVPPTPSPSTSVYRTTTAASLNPGSSALVYGRRCYVQATGSCYLSSAVPTGTSCYCTASSGLRYYGEVVSS